MGRVFRGGACRPCEKACSEKESFPFCTTEGRFLRGFSRLAVPEKRGGLTLFLAFFDRCGNSAPPFSAAGSGGALFPLFHRFN